MGSIISRIYDDYDDYIDLCQEMNVSSLDINKSDWYKHQRELEKMKDNAIIEKMGKRYFFSKEAKGPKDRFDRPTQYHFKHQLLEKRPKEIFSLNSIYGVETPYLFSIEFLDEDESIQFNTHDEILKMSIEEFRDYLEMRGFRDLFIYEK